MAGRETKAAVPWGEDAGTSLDPANDGVPAQKTQASRVRFSPRAPAEVVYLQPAEPQENYAPSEDPDLATHRPTPSRLSRWASRSVKIIPLFWTALLALAALQHAAETDRRIATRESAETKVEVQNKVAPEIRAAWREIAPDIPVAAPRNEKATPPVASSQTALSETTTAVTDGSKEDTPPAVVEQQLSQTARDEVGTRNETPVQPLIETPTPAYQTVDREPTAAAPEQQADTDKSAGSEEPSSTPANQASANAREPATGARRSRFAVPRAYRTAALRVSKDEFNARYFTVERVSRICP
jgi:hypothetical protein